ncbi:MAG: hypothetical protein E7439_06315 [Ruminococcaceae bacterium]|nr:hypothetical protein [Oscillospiraceae bacterium]
MELHFTKSICQCLQKVVCQTVSQEQTQEIRLPDSLPDIGRVLGCWGQVIIRGKEWRGNGMNVSGGVMVWVLYAPEDGSQIRSMEGWVPMQMKWDFPQTQRDGAICVQPLLKSVDARSVSPRKLMVRTLVSAMGEALEPVDMDIFTAPQVPEDVQLNKQTYPLELPMEAGEKSFQMEEDLSIPPSAPPVSQILRYWMEPSILEQKVLAGRLVFRGNAMLRMRYCTEDGSIHNWDWEIPMSQYTELDKDHSPSATASIVPIVTNLELNRDEEGKWKMNCGISAQYTVFDRQILELISDAYSVSRQVQPRTEMLKLPVRLEQRQEDMTLKGQWEGQGQKIFDISFGAGHPKQIQMDEELEMELPGVFQMLYTDENGDLQDTQVRCSDSMTMANDPGNRVSVLVQSLDDPHGTLTGDGAVLTANVRMTQDVYSEAGMPMVTALELGEAVQPDPNRPSLILRRTDDHGLWEIAKECGSTVDAICKANGLTSEPESGRLLLIPVM